MNLHQAYKLCSFFLAFEADMLSKGRPNIAKFARRQHERYYQKFLKGVKSH